MVAAECAETVWLRVTEEEKEAKRSLCRERISCSGGNGASTAKHISTAHQRSSQSGGGLVDTARRGASSLKYRGFVSVRCDVLEVGSVKSVGSYSRDALKISSVSYKKRYL